MSPVCRLFSTTRHEGYKLILSWKHGRLKKSSSSLCTGEAEVLQQEALCDLLRKLSALEQLRDDADETGRQLERQTEERRRTERQVEELQTQLQILDTSDPQH
ncbi:hypothetical protein INR49_020959, partial [Caranx melampygus]